MATVYPSRPSQIPSPPLLFSHISSSLSSYPPPPLPHTPNPHTLSPPLFQELRRWLPCPRPAGVPSPSPTPWSRHPSPSGTQHNRSTHPISPPLCELFPYHPSPPLPPTSSLPLTPPNTPLPPPLPLLYSPPPSSPPLTPPSLLPSSTLSPSPPLTPLSLPCPSSTLSQRDHGRPLRHQSYGSPGRRGTAR